jgi:REP element-mobilizing transposase RayT
MASRHPIHVTLRVLSHVWNLRSTRCFSAISAAFLGVHGRVGFRIVHFSVQGNHIHSIVEAQDARALSQGMQELTIRIAKQLNRVMDRRGSVFADRYHAHVLRTPAEVARAIQYVLRNFAVHAQRRGEIVREDWIDPCSSAAASALVNEPATWLLREGCRRAA